MEEWKTSYIAPASSYHAYAYGLLYPDPQASHASYWGPTGGGVVMDGGQHPGAVVPAVLNFSAPPGTRTQQPDLSPAYAGQKESSDSGDKEPQSPESWCSNGPDAPQSVQGLEESECSGSSLDAEPLSATLQDGEEPRETSRLRLGGDGGPAPDGDLINMAAAAVTEEPKAKKAKPRTAFSQEQMQALQQRFQLQRYLTPVEMKTFAGMIGLTYKQVKTWFQNRRMKFKRHQKDSSWVSERYPNISANAPMSKWPYPNFPSDAAPPSEYYSQQGGPIPGDPKYQSLPHPTSDYPKHSPSGSVPLYASQHPYQTPISPRDEEGAAEYSPDSPSSAASCTATPALPPHQRTVSSSSSEESWATLPSGGHGGSLRFDYSQQLQPPPPQFLYQPLEQVTVTPGGHLRNHYSGYPQQQHVPQPAPNYNHYGLEQMLYRRDNSIS
ncbi:homeobox protein NANOG [Acipenser oxyrinchus oxyrinchus]|uniref:Homeobox protein NANOG n=1 Tax=Acipenser oxyrinchus oxyrinchus TaxID=40147 RepID=A0AAD8FV14_ACIOX|nr:homeobox protein NANOG [Acipenser oxyrinchus oxyrinchus]